MSLRHAALGLLAECPASGYDLLKLFDVSLANVWPATQSQVYGELGRLTDAGWLTVSAEGPRGRKEYAITEAGLAEFHRWLTEVEPAPPRRNDMLLRVFFLGRLPPAQARAFLLRQARIAAEEHENLEALKPVTQGDGSLAVYGRLALERGLRMTATQRDWAVWAAAQITDGAPGAGCSDAAPAG